MRRKYEKTAWKARKGTDLNRFKKSRETSGYVVLENAPTSVAEPGTPFSPALMNHLEDGVESAHEGIEEEIAARQEAVENEARTRERQITDAISQEITDRNAAITAHDTNAAAHHVQLTGAANNDTDTSTPGVSGYLGAVLQSIWGKIRSVVNALVAHNTDNGSHADIRTDIASEIRARTQGDTDALNAARNYADQKAADLSNILYGVQALTLSGALLTRVIGGTTPVAKNLFDLSTVFFANKTLIGDANGTIGACRGQDSATITVETLSIAPISSTEPTLIGAVSNHASLPLTVHQAVAMGWMTPKLNDWANVNNDETLNNQKVEWYVTSIDTLGNITWGNHVIINASDYQAQTTAQDAGKMLVGGATPGTFGTSKPIEIAPTQNSNNPISSGAVHAALVNKVDKIPPRTPISTPAAKKFAHNEQGQVTDTADLVASDVGLGYGTCSTAASTAAKVGTLAGFVRHTGSVVGIKFSNTNTNANPTLNVNATGAAPIFDYRTGVAVSTPGVLRSGRIHFFLFDGTNWILLNPYLDAGLAYGTCSTVAATAAKVGALAGFVRSAGAVVGIKFDYTNSAANPTLDVNSTGAAAIIDYRSNTAAAVGVMGNGVHFFMFNGTNWVLINPLTNKANMYQVTFKISDANNNYLSFTLSPTTPIFANEISNTATFASVPIGDFYQAMPQIYPTLNNQSQRVVTVSASGMWEGVFVNHIALVTVNSTTLRLMINNTAAVATIDITNSSVSPAGVQFAVNVVMIN